MAASAHQPSASKFFILGTSTNLNCRRSKQYLDYYQATHIRVSRGPKRLLGRRAKSLSGQEDYNQANNRRSLEEFVGLGVINSIPDATAVDFFRERLGKAGASEEIFEVFSA